MYQPISKEIFHVHTWRCGHASMEEDYEYVEKAVLLGANRIVFTDHCPFPGDNFSGRMKMEQLAEYVSSMKKLKREYASQIEILFGLEIEYLPSFIDYYHELKNSGNFDLLVLGQHMYECDDGTWSFLAKDKSNEYVGLCKAMCDGIRTELFDVVAHPDRIFRRNKEWNSTIVMMAQKISEEANKRHIWLEKNYSSMLKKKFYREEFWEMLQGEQYLYGYDAHSVLEMEQSWNRH